MLLINVTCLTSDAVRFRHSCGFHRSCDQGWDEQELKGKCSRIAESAAAAPAHRQQGDNEYPSRNKLAVLARMGEDTNAAQEDTEDGSAAACTGWAQQKWAGRTERDRRLATRVP